MPPGYKRLVTPLLTGLAHVALTSSSLRTPLCAISTPALSIRLSLPHRFHQSAPIHLHRISTDTRRRMGSLQDFPSFDSIAPLRFSLLECSQKKTPFRSLRWTKRTPLSFDEFGLETLDSIVQVVTVRRGIYRGRVFLSSE